MKIFFLNGLHRGWRAKGACPRLLSVNPTRLSRSQRGDPPATAGGPDKGRH
jgi:hypothetical protein